MFAYLWIFLLGIRECLNIFRMSTNIITLGITGLQVLNLLFILQKEKWKISRVYFLLCILMVLVLYNSTTIATVNILLAIILLKNENIKEVFGAIAISYIFIFCIYGYAYSIGILQDITKIYPKGITHTLGFHNSNTPGLLFMQMTLVLGTLFLMYSNFILPLFLFLIPNYFIFTMTLSRTSYYCILLFIFLVIYFSFNRKYERERKLVVFVPILFFVLMITVSLSIHFSPILYTAGNAFLTGRPRLIYQIIDKMSILNFIIGYQVVDSAMDNAYLGIILNGGIFSVLIFMICTYNGLKNFDLRLAKKYLPFILVILISGLTEGTFSLFRLSTIAFYKILIDQFEIKNIKKNIFTKIKR